MHSPGEPDDCIEVVVRLYHFLDGQLDDARRALIQQHLDDCTNCLEAFDFEAELRQVVARRCQDRVPEALRARIHLAIEQQRLGPFDGPLGGLHPL